MSTAIFIGPSLAVATARERLPAVFLPPARQGDIYRTVSRFAVDAIGLVDGYFHQVPSVWHKEILWALAQGVPVWGAASMGALRAAELDAFGMRGVGCIYAAYRDGRFGDHPDVFDDDDEVALTHGPAAVGYASTSVALVDLRATLDRALDAGIVDRATRDAAVRDLRRTLYPERSYETLARTVRRLDAGQGAALAAALPEVRCSQKRADALEMLDTIAAGLPPPSIGFEFQHTRTWQRLLDSEP